VLDIEYSEIHAKYVTFSDDHCLGKKAPSLAGIEYVQGEAVKTGKPIALVFFAQYHKPGFPRLAMYSQLAEKFGKDIQFVALSIDPDVKSPKKYLDDPAGKYSKVYPLTFTVAHDTGRKVQDAYGPLLLGPVNIPHMFLIDANGTIVWHQDHSQVGATAASWEEQITRQFTSLIAGTPLESNGPNQYPEESDEEESDEDESDEEYDEDCD
jgi:peroxiredoxin